MNKIYEFIFIGRLRSPEKLNRKPNQNHFKWSSFDSKQSHSANIHQLLPHAAANGKSYFGVFLGRTEPSSPFKEEKNFFLPHFVWWNVLRARTTFFFFFFLFTVKMMNDETIKILNRVNMPVLVLDDYDRWARDTANIQSMKPMHTQHCPYTT